MKNEVFNLRKEYFDCENIWLKMSMRKIIVNDDRQRGANCYLSNELNYYHIQLQLFPVIIVASGV